MIGSKIYFLLVTLASVGSASAAVANEAGYRWLANEGRLGTDELYQRLVKGNKGGKPTEQQLEKMKNMGVLGHLKAAAKDHHNAFQSKGGWFSPEKPIVPPMQGVRYGAHNDGLKLVMPPPDLSRDTAEYGSFRDRYWDMDNSKDAHKALAWRKFKGKFGGKKGGPSAPGGKTAGGEPQ